MSTTLSAGLGAIPRPAKLCQKDLFDACTFTATVLLSIFNVTDASTRAGEIHLFFHEYHCIAVCQQDVPRESDFSSWMQILSALSQDGAVPFIGIGISSSKQ